MKNEFLVTLLTSSGEKQCLQRFKNVVLCFNKVLRECDAVVRTQCWNLRGPSAKNNVEDVRESLDNSDLVICVVDPTVTEGVRDDVLQALDWVRESFQMSFFAVKQRNMFIFVKESSSCGVGSKQAQRAVSFLENLYKKDYKPITYPSENAFALTLLYQLCNMVRSELWCFDFPLEDTYGLADVFRPHGISFFGIDFLDLPWVRNCKEYNDLVAEIDALRKALISPSNRYGIVFTLEQKELVKERMECEMLHSYYLLCRFFSRGNTPEITQAIAAFLNGDIVMANQKLNIKQLVRRVSAYRKNPAELKNAGGTYKMEFDYLLNSYLLKIHLLRTMDPVNSTATEEELYNDVLSLSQGLVTFVEQLSINDEAGRFFYGLSKITQTKTQFESSMRIFESFSKEKQKRTLILGLNGINMTAKCQEIELGNVRMVEGETLPRKTVSVIKTIRVLYQKALSLVTPLFKRYPKPYWPVYADIYRNLYEFFIKTGQIHRADKLSEETHLMISKMDTVNQYPCQNQTYKTYKEDNPEDNEVNICSCTCKGEICKGEKGSESYPHQASLFDEEIPNSNSLNSNPANGSGHQSYQSSDKNCAHTQRISQSNLPTNNFIRLLDKVECQVDIRNSLPDRAQKKIPQDIESLIRSVGSDPYKVEDDLFSWIDSEEAVPDIFSILKWNSSASAAPSIEPALEPSNQGDNTDSVKVKKVKEEECPHEDKFDGENTDQSESDPYVIWDTAQILLDQAKIFQLKENYIQTIRFAAASIESINRRLVDNARLVEILPEALRILADACYASDNVVEGYECLLVNFNLLLPQTKQHLSSNYGLIKHEVFALPMMLCKIPKQNWGLISSELLAYICEFIMENFALTEPREVSWLLKVLLDFFRVKDCAEHIERTQDHIRKVELILQSQNKAKGAVGGLFGYNL